jgi:hypothetical protein
MRDISRRSACASGSKEHQRSWWGGRTVAFCTGFAPILKLVRLERRQAFQPANLPGWTFCSWRLRMKSTTNCAVGFAVLLSSVQIQWGQPLPVQVGVGAESPPAGDVAYQIVARGPHHRVWSRVALETNALGNAVAHTNSYTELATGMHYASNGQWLESKAEIELLADGAAACARPIRLGPGNAAASADRVFRSAGAGHDGQGSG